jgi:nicotinamidase-related amidase
MPKAQATPGKTLLSPSDHTLIMIDHQSQMSVFPKDEITDRTSMNTWEDVRIAKRVNEIGKGRIVLAGLWTSVCIVGPALSALDQGFEVYVYAKAMFAGSEGH